MAYSFEGSFNLDNMSPGQEMFMNYYKESIEFLKENPISASDEIVEEWLDLATYTPGKSFKNKTTVGPLLLAKWNQDWPYNAALPESSDCTGYGANGHVYVGCVATAMVQVMKYYNWPSSGEGSKTHLSWFNGGWGNKTVNFAQQTYDWYSIPFEGSGVNDELAKINYHAGVAVGMHWGCDGSSSQTENIATALKTYFKYNTNITAISKSNYTETNWKNELKQQLNARQPMAYSGSPEAGGAGHAWNCDGYQGEEHFHMNWGWGGSGDGFYTLDNLNSTATPSSGENNFIKSQQAVINIHPRDSEYPPYCSGMTTLTGHQGALNDGSESKQYKNNQSCYYLIEPECGTIIKLKFDSFDLGAGDVVNIYNGSSINSQLLDSYSNSNTPNTTTLTANGGAMLIEFLTDGSGVGYGWNASYDITYCTTNILHNTTEGTISDGSGPCNYEGTLNCSWKIEPPGAEWININFTEFDISSSQDFVEIFRNGIGAANQVAKFTANDPPTGPVMVESGVAFIRFRSFTNSNAPGWSFDYNASNVSVETEFETTRTKIYPNPSDGNARIHYYAKDAQEADFVLYDITGKTVFKTSLNSTNGIFNLSLNEAVGYNLNNGMYFLEISSNNNKTTEKLIISN
ncbi:MAG: T9SS type A sorting domain-containing protein [Bacteroidales bacterium]|nr:T9SS type A sorting domain-containing protein [Bacteroidales bacterium]